MKIRLLRLVQVFFMYLIYTFFYLPIVLVIVYSFNKSAINAVWTGFTFHWYSVLTGDARLLNALRNSFEIAAITTVITIVIGTIGAVGMYRYKFKGKAIFDGILYIPIVIPEIVMGISLLVFFARLNIPFGITTIVFSHVTFCIPFLMVVVKATLDGFDKSLEEAAMDLGANEVVTLLRITAPIIAPGILAGALLSFSMSIDDFVCSFFLAGPSSETLPLEIFSSIRHGITPEINAICTGILVVTITMVVIAERLRMMRNGKPTATRDIPNAEETI